jgi:hypothetical protein
MHSAMKKGTALVYVCLLLLYAHDSNAEIPVDSLLSSFSMKVPEEPSSADRLRYQALSNQGILLSTLPKPF